MKILYLGQKKGTSLHAARAIERLGHEIVYINPDGFVPQNPTLNKLHFETGGLFCDGIVTDNVLKALPSGDFDLTIVNGGRYVGPRLVRECRKRSGVVINRNNDDPYGRRDRYSWSLFRRAVREYDLLMLRRKENITEAQRLGAKHVEFAFLTADEVAHAPRPLTPEDHARWDSKVLFVGTWMPERGPFMAELVRRGVPLSIYGNRWQLAKDWPVIAKAWKGPGTTTDDDYARAIQCSKICLGLLSKGNRDSHTRRSIEIPYLGGILCAERTDEHLELYREKEEAIFWSDAGECADHCFELLQNESLRQRVAIQGHKRCLENQHFNEPAAEKVIQLGLSIKQSATSSLSQLQGLNSRGDYTP